MLQPLSHVWAAVSDPTLWPLYHRPIQKARLHQRVTNNINLGEPWGRKCQVTSGYLQMAQARPLGVGGGWVMDTSGLPTYLLTCFRSCSVPGVQYHHMCPKAATGFLLCLRGSQRGGYEHYLCRPVLGEDRV